MTTKDFSIFEEKTIAQIFLSKPGSYRYVTDSESHVTYHGPLRDGEAHGTWTHISSDGEVEIEFTKGFYSPYSINKNARPHTFDRWRPVQDLPWTIESRPDMHIVSQMGAIQRLCRLITSRGPRIHGS